MEGLVCLHPQLQTGSQRPRKGGEGHEGPRGCSIRSRGAEGTDTPRQRGALPVTESHLQPVPGPLGAHPSPGARPGWLPRLGGFPQGEVAGGPLLTQAICRDAQVSCRTRDGILSTPGRADSCLTRGRLGGPPGRSLDTFPLVTVVPHAVRSTTARLECFPRPVRNPVYTLTSRV